MADVEALCRRVIVIHRGALLFDGDLAALVRRFARHKTIVVTGEGGAPDLRAFGEVTSAEDGCVTLRVPRLDAARVTGRLLERVTVVDLTVTDPPLDEVIEQVFAHGPTVPEADAGPETGAGSGGRSGADG
jgi:ABC-2 type transport system ATP-binding protein